MNTRIILVSVILIILGAFIGVGYAYLVLVSSAELLIQLIRVSLAFISIIIGAFLGATGLIMLRGIRVEEENENTS
ncbi:MAG: hypothetical protein GSR72_01790 [Desulfurococcales archaeon]|nr:hypothetical protein [Desulfurococcales archaeon]MEB3788607.1 hypothetical protein [Desulfurococcales archaeon]